MFLVVDELVILPPPLMYFEAVGLHVPFVVSIPTAQAATLANAHKTIMVRKDFIVRPPSAR
jgi:hypothetical protein